MSQRSGESLPPLNPDHFSNATPDTRAAFDSAMEWLHDTFMERTKTVESATIGAFRGDLNSHHAHVFCGVQESRNPLRNTTETSAHLSVIIATALDPPATVSNILSVFTMRPSLRRTFSYGEVRGSMSDAEYGVAIAYLRQTLSLDEWAWLEKARLLASAEHDPSFLPFAVTDLLDRASNRPPVRRSKEYFLGKVLFNNGTRLQADWVEANPAHLRYLSPDAMTRDITIELPANESYFYAAYADGTEQMLVESPDAARRTDLTARGFAAMKPGDWSSVTSEHRRLGVQAPSDALMRQFNLLIAHTLEAEATPPGPVV